MWPVSFDLNKIVETFFIDCQEKHDAKGDQEADVHHQEENKLLAAILLDIDQLWNLWVH